MPYWDWDQIFRICEQSVHRILFLTSLVEFDLTRMLISNNYGESASFVDKSVGPINGDEKLEYGNTVAVDYSLNQAC